MTCEKKYGDRVRAERWRDKSWRVQTDLSKSIHRARIDECAWIAHDNWPVIHLPAAHDTETLAVKAEGESAWLGSERGRRNGDRFDADHIEKFSCAEDLGDAMCTKRQHPAPITRDQIVGVARLSHGK
jgi:hypothetical protein